MSRIVVAITSVVILLVVVGVLFATWPKSTTGGIAGLPSYALASSQIREAYQFAADNPDALDGIPCSCGCMRHLHDGRLHTRGLHDCFLRDGNFERHSSQCDMCINAALDVKQMASDGFSKDEIKSRIVAKYGAG